MTIYDELLAAGLPVVIADESGAVSMGAMTQTQRGQFTDILLQHFQPAVWAEVQQTRVDMQTVRNAYQDMITRLEQIQAASNPTNAQVIQAIRDEALYIERIMKIIKRMVT